MFLALWHNRASAVNTGDPLIMNSELTYRGLTVSEGVNSIKAQLTKKELKNTMCFSDLHDHSDANMLLPFYNDVGGTEWLAFANAVIDEFDSKAAER